MPKVDGAGWQWAFVNGCWPAHCPANCEKPLSAECPALLFCHPPCWTARGTGLAKDRCRKSYIWRATMIRNLVLLAVLAIGSAVSVSAQAEQHVVFTPAGEKV